MKILVTMMTFLLFVGIIGFVLTNLDTRVPVTVWKTQYSELPLFLVVIVAVFAGIFFAGIIGVAEGANIRLANRRLGRDALRLEAELNYLRTQPAPGPRPEPDAVQPADPGVAREPAQKAPAEPTVATAPVYGGDDEWASDDDEDVYSGGRAV